MLPHEETRRQFPCLCHVWLDGGYTGQGKGKVWIEQHLGWTVEMVHHPPKPHGVWVPAAVGLPSAAPPLGGGRFVGE